MKKFIFTCFALTLGMTTFANNLNEAEKNKETTIKKTAPEDCDSEREGAYNEVISNGGSHYAAYFAGQLAWAECMELEPIWDPGN